MRQLAGVLAVLLLAGCGGVSVTVHEPNREANCARIAELYGAGKPLSRVRADPPPLVPAGLAEARGVVVPAGPDPEAGVPHAEPISPKAPDIALPVPYVDQLVVIGKVDVDVDELRANTQRAIADRGWRIGSSAGSESNGELVRFSLGYSGPYVDGSVSTKDCDDGPWVVLSRLIVPPVPAAASQPLPSCAELFGRFPAGVYPEPELLDDPRIEVDDEHESRRECYVRDRTGTSSDSSTYFRLVRRPVDPESWYARVREMHTGAAELAAMECRPGKEPSRLPDGPDGAYGCERESGFEAVGSVAAPVGNDYLIWVKHTERIESGAGNAAARKQPTAVATKVLIALGGS